MRLDAEALFGSCVSVREPVSSITGPRGLTTARPSPQPEAASPLWSPLASRPATSPHGARPLLLLSREAAGPPRHPTSSTCKPLLRLLVIARAAALSRERVRQIVAKSDQARRPLLRISLCASRRRVFRRRPNGRERRRPRAGRASRLQPAHQQAALARSARSGRRRTATDPAFVEEKPASTRCAQKERKQRNIRV